MKRIKLMAFRLLLGVLLFASVCAAQSVPKEIWGKWMISREIATRTISCWGEADAKKLIGTEIEYSDRIFRWGSMVTNDAIAESKITTAQQFRDENSGGSVNSSQVDFQQLGIKRSRTTEIKIHHADAHVTAATNEIPGDDLLVKNGNTIVFSVCNIYFEAKRNLDRK